MDIKLQLLRKIVPKIGIVIKRNKNGGYMDYGPDVTDFGSSIVVEHFIWDSCILSIENNYLR